MCERCKSYAERARRAGALGWIPQPQSPCRRSWELPARPARARQCALWRLLLPTSLQLPLLTPNPTHSHVLHPCRPETPFLHPCRPEPPPLAAIPGQLCGFVDFKHKAAAVRALKALRGKVLPGLTGVRGLVNGAVAAWAAGTARRGVRGSGCGCLAALWAVTLCLAPCMLGPAMCLVIPLR